MVKLANCWGAVQAYYALYNAAQSVMVAEGSNRPPTHESTQAKFIDLWTRKTSMAIAPWSLAAADPGTTKSDINGFMCGPANRDLNPRRVHAWSNWSNEESWDVAAEALSSTRKKKIEEAFSKKRKEKSSLRAKAWKQQEEKRLERGLKKRVPPKKARAKLTDDEKRSVAEGVRPVTMFDYLYRLRVKANYNQADDFWEGPKTDDDAAEFARSLVLITAASMLVHEVRVIGKIGPHLIFPEMDKFLSLGRDGLAQCNASIRRNLYKMLSN